jgi:hypothetical protein
MKRQKSCGPRLGKLVHQLPGVVTFAYDLRFRRVIARWKGIVEEIHFGASIMPSAIIENLYLEKPSFGPSKWPRKLKPAKNSKLPKWPENCFEPFGKGGWPPISTWINFFLFMYLSPLPYFPPFLSLSCSLPPLVVSIHLTLFFFYLSLSHYLSSSLCIPPPYIARK